MNKTEALAILVEQANRGEIVFSTNATISLKIQKSLDDPDCSVDSASKLILNDPLLAARVVAIANSAVYCRNGNNVNNVRAAINRLGFRTVRSIVASVVMRQLAGTSKNPVIRSMVEKLWEHSAQVAALAQVLAHRVTKLDPDTAMFAGIVHEVGAFYLLSRAEEFPCLLEKDPPAPSSTTNGGLPSTFSDSIIDKETSEAAIGRTVLKILMLPAEVVEAVEALWYGLRAMPPESLGDTLLLANELARTPSPLDMKDDYECKQCVSEIDFVIGDGSLNSILEESEEEVRTLSAALMS